MSRGVLWVVLKTYSPTLVSLVTTPVTPFGSQPMRRLQAGASVGEIGAGIQAPCLQIWPVSQPIIFEVMWFVLLFFSKVQEYSRTCAVEAQASVFCETRVFLVGLLRLTRSSLTVPREVWS